MLYHHSVVIKNYATLFAGLLVHDVIVLECGKRLFNVHSFLFVCSSDRLLYWRLLYGSIYKHVLHISSEESLSGDYIWTLKV